MPLGREETPEWPPFYPSWASFSTIISGAWCCLGWACPSFQDWRAECRPRGVGEWKAGWFEMSMTPFPCLKMQGTPVPVCSQRGFDRIFKIKKKCELKEFKSASAKGLYGFPLGERCCRIILPFPGMSGVKWWDVCQVLGLAVTRRCYWRLPWDVSSQGSKVGGSTR